MSPDDLDDDVRNAYAALKILPDGRLCGVLPLLFHWTMHVDIDPIGYNDRYCYATRQLALDALEKWDGTADPQNWHRHPNTGRRKDLETGREWVSW